jgi:hypothetical protein
MNSDALAGLERRIASELSRRPECFITHPTEVRILQQLSAEELQEFAHRNSWRTVRRLGGRQYQFYNDTYERLLNEENDTPTGGAERRA